MNIYDLKQIHCHKCGKYIGEIYYDAEIMVPFCGNCLDKNQQINKHATQQVLVHVEI